MKMSFKEIIEGKELEYYDDELMISEDQPDEAETMNNVTIYFGLEGIKKLRDFLNQIFEE